MQIADALRLAIRHFNAGQGDEGARICTAILDAQPANPVANTLLARHHLRAGAPAAARPLIDTALRAAPDYAPALDLDARLRDEHEADAPAAVDRAYRRALAVSPGASATWFARANLIQGAMDDPAGSVVGYARAAAIAPDDDAVATNRATAALKLGDPAIALALCAAVLARTPMHIRARALQITALYDLGRGDEADALVGFGSLVRALDLPVPDGFADIHAFNRAFGDAIRTHPDRRDDFDPVKRAIRGGSLVTDLLHHQAPAITAFHAALDRAIAEYGNLLPNTPGHPHVAARPAGYALDVWGNILRSQGHQSAHIHNLGWLSGVYYVEMPPIVRDDDPSHEGWIEFNRPGYGIPDRGTAHIHRIRPQSGVVVLFPSYVWHHTVPFDGTGERVSVAFDLHPR
jgi:hypothetical protein